MWCRTSGERRGLLSIRINQQWRTCCEWPTDATGPSNVEIADYLELGE
ncbi:MAG: addiction module toxin RelE [Rhodospirillales bacterium 24-66-33]|nr:MAG: addiction module toxin RelE [Rhodospirillales bacterium 35-66-84]OYZ96099.1 MAG: addiction module toxin RelE [Rhodospirillales bacterium 24-66-33]OZB21244.1 MAG: addiction module toxin RelE [Rhodospirillales bacterium 39-66-50]